MKRNANSDKISMTSKSYKSINFFHPFCVMIILMVIFYKLLYMDFGFGIYQSIAQKLHFSSEVKINETSEKNVETSEINRNETNENKKDLKLGTTGSFQIESVARVNLNSSAKTGTHKANYRFSLKDNQIFIENHYFECSTPRGRLGNTMFEWASAFGIAHTIGYTPCIKESHPLLQHFDMKQKCQFEITNLKTLDETQCRDEIWRHSKDYLSYNLTVSGLLQSWKYFVKISDEIRKMFLFKQIYLTKAIEFLRTLRQSVSDKFVGIHVRRGDFFQHIKLGYTLAEMSYINTAMSYYRNKTAHALFIVVSDDMRWCKNSIKGMDVRYSTFTDPVIDLAILSLCNHTIITGGTFGWWGGWLSGGTVVYLKDFPRPGSKLEHLTYNSKEDYYPPHWIGFNN